MKQTQALDVMKLGHNVFLTGEPGSGKTHTLNEFIQHCLKHDVGIGVTASTGIAATHINGMTIHSWSGIGIEDELEPEQIDRLVKKSSLKSRFKQTRVLIIDEVSMLDNKRLDLIDQVMRAARDDTKPFGGLQVILCGDLFQLPPVSIHTEGADYPHRSRAWQSLNLKICYLSEQYRQDRDKRMLNILRGIRSRDVDHDSIELLRQRLETEPENENTTRLYTHNANVDELNQKKLNEIDAESHAYQIQAEGQKKFIEQLSRSCLAPEILELKVGAEIICIANNPARGYVNGTRGTVVDFDNGKPIIKLLEGREIKLERHSWMIKDGDKTLAELTQYPVRLAWAITVHKSQGMSLDAAEIDLSRSFAPGMGYVALSRLKNLEGLYLSGINNLALEVNPEISEFDQLLQQQSELVVDGLLAMPDDQIADLHKQARTNLSLDYAKYNKKLLKKLKAWRLEEAKAQDVPAYRVFSDKTLMALSAELPNTKDELQTIHGIGPKKMDQYGENILALINQSVGKLV